MSAPNELFSWNKSLTVKNDTLDHEHQEIIQCMNVVYDLNTRAPNKTRLLAAFDKLINVTEAHFADEERFMESMKYERIKNHKSAHDELITSLYKYRSELESSVYVKFPSSVFDFFKVWLVSHIMIVDRHYAEASTHTQSAAG